MTVHSILAIPDGATDGATGRVCDCAEPVTASARRLDRAAIAASLLCAVHCLVFPLLAASLPLVGLLTRDHLAVHWGLLGFAVPAGLYALMGGRARAGSMPLTIGIAGFATMLAGVTIAASAGGETRLTLAGAGLVALAHWRNLRAPSRPAL